MKTEEDEAFDELAKRQGDWGGGFKAKQAMAADKFIAAEERKVGERYGYVPKLHPSEWMDSPITADKLHWSDCAVHNEPAYPAGECDCGPTQPVQEPIYNITIFDNAHPKGIPYEDWVQPAQEPEILTIVYQSGYHDGKQAALAGREWNFCERCGKRTADLTVIHTCTPPQEKNNGT